MKIIRYPKKETWAEILRRSVCDTKIEESVMTILQAVKTGGDGALRQLTRTFDGADITEFAVSREEFTTAAGRMPEDLKGAIQLAKANIEKFHATQRETVNQVETTPGVFCWRESVPIEKVGIYVPSGTAPLFSTVLMLGVPATLAGCSEIIICSPPGVDGRIADPILYTAELCDISKVFKVGGAQAIAAMAYGTETIPNVDKIFGPGNQFVTCAKQIVSTEFAIDMPAGPSEVAVFADDSCNPAFVAADLLSQAEHGPDSQVLLVATSEKVITETIVEIERQIVGLPRREIAQVSLANSKAILVRDLDSGLEILNEYAAEHLILAVEDADAIAKKVTNAGSVFLGNYSCESAGDYASGTNHTLPTGGYARAYGGVSLDSFVKKITFQRLTVEGIRNLGPSVELMASAEGLEAHKRAISVRLEAINGL